MDVRVGLEHQRIDTFPLWCWRLLRVSPLDSKEIQPGHPKGNQSWIFIGRTDAKAETPILWPPDAKSKHWKQPWCWKRLRVGEEGNRRWDGWMASLTQWKWIWVNSGRQWSTGKTCMLQFVGSQRVGDDLATEQEPLTSCHLGMCYSKETRISHTNKHRATQDTQYFSMSHYCPRKPKTKLKHNVDDDTYLPDIIWRTPKCLSQ